MLFTDGIILTMQDLREHDNFVLDIASTESIELSSKMAIAQRAVGYELASFLSNRETPISLDRVVVNDELRDLLAIQTLAAVYSDAYNRHLNDRYSGRAKEFRQASERNFQRYLQNGVGVAGTPVRRADRPTVTAVSGGELAPGMYVVQIAWEHLSRTVGERSEPVTVECLNGALDVAPVNVPPNMGGWHVFITSSELKPVRQNIGPIATDVVWTQSDPVRFDLPDIEPSGPDYYVRQATQMVRR